MTRARVKGPRIDVETAKTMLDSGTALMLDVVASHVWPSMTRTIQGSIRIPPEDVEKRIGELPRNKTIITYCT
jgi:hypothetical protein